MSKRNITGWLWDNRSSTRVAFLMQLGARATASIMGLVWTPLLVGAMGTGLYGKYVAFNKIMTLGGLGDLGMGGVIGLRTAQYLGQGREDELRKFLAAARGAFLTLALTAGGLMILLSPWLPALLKFKPVEGLGSLTLLFSVGGVLVAGVVISSYLNNLNYACGNVLWPIVPMLLLTQAGALGQWLLARQHEPLWIQFLPAVATALAGMLLVSLFIRVSHPTLAGWWPLHSNWRLIGSLLEGSFWVYLCSLGNAVYRSTDALLINAGSHFPAGTLTGYDTNYRICDVTVSLAITAGFVSMPKITRWLASPEAPDQARARTEILRLNQFQALLGIAVAVAYLGGNSLFMKIWWWHRKTTVAPAPLLLQMAFALNMAVVTSGAAGLEVALRSGPRGLRWSGALMTLTALLNVGLALVAMRAGSLVGIAMATVGAQSLQNLLLSAYACRRLKLQWLSWSLRALVLPVAVVLLAGWLRLHVPLSTPEHGVSAANVLILAGSYVALVLGAAALLGIRPAFIKEELAILRGFIRR